MRSAAPRRLPVLLLLVLVLVLGGTLGAAGFEPVRMVAIDEDWSALRFRRVEHIKKMTRSFAMTDAGKEKVRKSRTE